jgi:hypothetical protein
MSLIQRSDGTGPQSDRQKAANLILESAISKSVMESKQQGRKASSVLVQYLPSVAAEMERLATSPDSSPADKLAAAQVLAKLVSRTICAEASVRRKATARKHTALQEKRLAERQQERADKKAKRQAQVAEQLAETARQLGGTDGTQ